MNDSLSRRRRRVKLIRTRVVTGAVALFVAVFGGITAQLAAGDDPALTASSTVKATKTTKTTKTTTQQSQQQQQHQSTAVSPVTTRQS